MKIKEPKFDKFELVTLFENGVEYKTQIGKRWYEPDEELWYYQVSGSEQFYLSDSLQFRK